MSMVSHPSFELLIADDWRDYELLDCGDGRKLERFGAHIFNRPDAQALWKPQNPIEQWSASATFDAQGDEDKGKWDFQNGSLPDFWSVDWRGISLHARCAAFRHMGLFPEHSVHWSWAQDHVRLANRPVRILNLFGYTGAMSLACAKAGAEVVHLDASPKSIGYGKECQLASDLGDAPIRWICDDAVKFLQRELRRGRSYDGVVLDPPKYGRGPKKEIWQLDTGYPELLDLVRALLSPDPLFVILTVYAVRLSYLAVGQSLAERMEDLGGQMQWGEMALQESGRGNLLPTALYARWSGLEG